MYTPMCVHGAVPCQSMGGRRGGWAHVAVSLKVLSTWGRGGRVVRHVGGGSVAHRAPETQGVSSNFPTLCSGRRLAPCALSLGGPWRSTDGCLGMFHSSPAPFPGPTRPPTLSFPDSSTFGLAGVVRLHEVAGAAAEVAALGIVAELGAGAEAQALVDVWGDLQRGVTGSLMRAGVPAHCPPSFPTLASWLARHGVEA